MPDKPLYSFENTLTHGNGRKSKLDATFSPLYLSGEPKSSAGGGEDFLTPSGAIIPPVFKQVAQGSGSRLKTRQLWEGTVTEVRDGGFVAVLSDRTNPLNPDEEASFDFDLTEISSDDQPLVSAGASFFWVIGNEQTRGGQVKNVSMLQFRRVPSWTKRNLAEAVHRGRKLRQSFLETK